MNVFLRKLFGWVPAQQPGAPGGSEKTNAGTEEKSLSSPNDTVEISQDADTDGPGAGGGYEPTDADTDGPGAGGGYEPTDADTDGPGAGGGYEPSDADTDSDGPGAGGGYEPSDADNDGPGAGGGYREFEALSDGPGAGGGYFQIEGLFDLSDDIVSEDSEALEAANEPEFAPTWLGSDDETYLLSDGQQASGAPEDSETKDEATKDGEKGPRNGES